MAQQLGSERLLRIDDGTVAAIAAVTTKAAGATPIATIAACPASTGRRAATSGATESASRTISTRANSAIAT
jgi:hypothetical protein